jgi:Arc/MetJ-type ribon-helix-helix transcriptional regulator
MKSSISAKIPTELYEEVQAAIKEEKYTSNTECIIKGLTLLLRIPDQEDLETNSLLPEKEKEIQSLQKEVNSSKAEVQSLQEEVKRSKDEVSRSKEDYIRQIKSLEEKLNVAPDPSVLAQLRTRSEELERHNESLKAELEKTGQRYDNYMAQMQTLIKQKAIEAPGAKKPWWKIW